MRSYKLTTDAKQDLVEIYYTGHSVWGEAQADIYLNTLYEVFERIGELPKIGVKQSELGQGIHRLNVGAHAVFYSVLNKHPEILRVLRQEAQPDNWL